MEAPSGTVTLMFSDIVGSTRLWETDPEAMAAALRVHDQMLRHAIVDEGGYVFKTVGDEFCAAFSDAGRALRAAEAIQRAVNSHEWPPPAAISVRIGLNTGFCDERDGDYFGPTVNRTARLTAVAHAGQTVMSAAAAELVAPLEGREVHLRDLGRHRLRDLGRPEHVFQADFAGLRLDFPPLRSLDGDEFLNNLPTQLTSFVGRSKILPELLDTVASSRLVTLTGAGGSGKTRLAIQAAAELAGRWPDGVWFVDLAPIIDAHLVSSAIMSSMGVREDSLRSPEESLLDFMSSRSSLILLDNCEHVIDVCAALADRVLQSAPGVRILATSREPLGVSGERVVRVPSMSLPEEAEGEVNVVAAESSEAVLLFLERARDYQPGFQLDATNVARVTSLCRRLDGIPLALELAAARLRSMGLDDVERRLDQRFRLLTGGSRSSLPRQRTLEALVDWSFELLNPAEQRLLCRLSVFSGFDLTSAESVGALDANEWEVADLLGSLVDKSLVQTEAIGQVFRYRLLETIRAFSFDRLSDLGADAVRETRRAHAEHFLEFSNSGTVSLRAAGAFDFLWLMAMEHQNLRLAINHYLDEPGQAGSALDIMANLREGWSLLGNYREIIDLCETVLTHPETMSDSTPRAQILYLSGFLRASSDPATVDRYYDDALAVARRTGDDAVVARVLAMKGMRLTYTHGEVEGVKLIDEAMSAADRIDDEYLRAFVLDRQGCVLLRLDPGAARRAFRDALAISTRLGDVVRQQSCCTNLGNLEAIAGNLVEARDFLSRAIGQGARLPTHSFETSARSTLTIVLLRLGDLDAATEQAARCVAIARRTSVLFTLGYTLLSSGCVITERGHSDDAVVVLSAADEIFEHLGYQIEDLEDAARARAIDQLRSALTSQDFESARATGRSMTTSDALELARRRLTPSP